MDGEEEWRLFSTAGSRRLPPTTAEGDRRAEVGLRTSNVSRVGGCISPKCRLEIIQGKRIV